MRITFLLQQKKNSIGFAQEQLWGKCCFYERGATWIGLFTPERNFHYNAWRRGDTASGRFLAEVENRLLVTFLHS